MTVRRGTNRKLKHTGVLVVCCIVVYYVICIAGFSEIAEARGFLPMENT